MSVAEQIDDAALRRIVAVFHEALRAHSNRLNLLNVYPVPDGDTGTNMTRTLDAVVAEIDAAEERFDATCGAISHGSLMGARGNSGVILSQILRGLATTFTTAAGDSGQRAISSASDFADALSAASQGAYRAVLTPVEGTILTVVREASEAAQAAASGGAALSETVQRAYRAGADALARTPEMLPVLKQAGVVDAGGAGFLLLLDAATHVVAGSDLQESADAVDAGVVLGGGPIADRATAASDTGPRYEVMYFCDLVDDRIDDLKARWGEIGDSIVVVGGDGLWNCHVHTDDIGAAIEAALDLDGRPSRIRVSDLHDEVAHEHQAREDALMVSMAATEIGSTDGAGVLERVGCAVVAVSSGDGLSTIFSDLGVRRVVGGGQSDNPSTAELLAAVESAGADAVVILPNNKNIIPVANQVAELTSIPVHVVPTVSMPQALSALMAFDTGGDPAAVADAMGAAAAGVVTAEITQAVRDSSSPVGAIATGDWLGIVRADGIVAVGDEPLEVICRTLDHVLDGERELLTVLVGSDADAGVLEALLGWLEGSHRDVEVEVHTGGQPLYPFIFGAE